VDTNCPFNFNFLIGALASTKVDANEELLASTYIVDADSPILVDANSPFNFFLKFFDRCISVH
jgi:hypothetical protein